MSSNRRDFLRRVALTSAALGARAVPELSAQERSAAMPTPRASAMMKAFGLKYPIAASGHVQAISPLEETLPRVLDIAKTTPVMAAGGIATGQDIRRALLAGASGVFMGTRFVATREAFAHEEYKAALIKAKASDSVLTVCFQDGWPNAPHGALRNRTLTMWEAAGCPGPGKRPGEGDLLATTDAGKGVGAIKDLPGAGELMERLWQECLSG